ncbi:probable AT-rich interactive domain-containing protein 2 at N-terminal half [Coccomyxa sp. Obi]|nr:probable AT-rich interactive domain-containing protein 2 at N-terminal half [Coccomyxa sp. Obi]
MTGPQYVATAGGLSAAYPPAQATHDEVVADRQLFMRTLRALHEALGTQFRIPMVSGRELDLHLLYKQVTSLGGLEAVITAKKWTEVSQPFQFPPSFTSKSFTLRKMYSRLLHDYEQVYFHHNTGPPTLPPGADGTKLEGGAAMTSSNPAYKRRRIDLAAPQQLPAAAAAPRTPPALTAFHVGAAAAAGQAQQPGALLDLPITGTVEAQFDAGYFVSIVAGGQEFRGESSIHHRPKSFTHIGVLYTPPIPLLGAPQSAATAGVGPTAADLSASPRDLAHAAMQQQQAAAGVQPRRSRAARRDPLEPKQNKTPFNFFSIDARSKAKAEHPSSDQKEISKIVGEMWQRATPEEKAPYVEQARIDKARYQEALNRYQQRMAAEGAEQAAAEESSEHKPPGLEATTPEAAGPSSGGPPRWSLPTPVLQPAPLRLPPRPVATGPTQLGVVYGVPMEGTISPREQEAAQQMQQLHRGAGGGGGRGAAAREASADPEPGRALFAASAQPSAAAAAGSAAGFSEQQDTDAEREEYEDEGVDGDGLQ